MVCPNHLSYVDPIAFAHFLYDNGHPPYFLAKESVFRIPVVGRMITHAGQIPVYRGSTEAAEAFRAAVDAVHEGKCVADLPRGHPDPRSRPVADDRQDRRRPGRADHRVPADPGGAVGPAGDPRAVRRRLRLLPRKTMHVWPGPPVDLSDLQGEPLDREVLGEATERLHRRDHRAAGADPRRARPG